MNMNFVPYKYQSQTHFTIVAKHSSSLEKRTQKMSNIEETQT